MGLKLTRKADQDIVEIYLRGAADFGLDQAERYHQGLAQRSTCWRRIRALLVGGSS